jgi:hypothetical protein
VTLVKYKLILVRLEIVTQDWGMVCAERAIGSEIILGTRRNFLVMWVKWKHASIRLEIVLIWPNIGAWFAPNVPWAWKTFWPRPMDLLGGVGQMESCFGTFGDIVNLGAR